MKFKIVLFGFLLILLSFPFSLGASPVKDRLIKASQSSVYYYAEDGNRYVFPNEKTYFSWFANFSNVINVTDQELADIAIGGNVTYRPGVKMIKIITDPKVYHISGGGVLRWIKSEALAKELYGENWTMLVEDVSDAFFVNYTIGNPIEIVSDINLTTEVNNFTTINIDKNIVQSGNPLYSNTNPSVKSIALTQKPAPVGPTYSWDIKTLNSDSYFHKNLYTSDINNSFFVAWNDDRNGQNEVFYQKYDSNLVGEGSIVRASSNISDSINGKILYNGTGVYYLWEDSAPLKRALYLRRFDTVGNLIKEQLFTSTTYATSQNPDFAWNESNQEFGVAWWDTRSTQNGAIGNLYFARITVGGLKVGNESKISESSATIFSPKIISAREKYLIFWQENNNILVANVTKFGVVSKISTIASVSGMTNLNVYWNGSTAGLVWDNGGALYYLQVSEDASKVGEAVLLVSAQAYSPDILYDNAKYVITYSDKKDIYYMEIDNLGQVITDVVRVTSESSDVSMPMFAKNSSTTIITWVDAVGATYDNIKAAIRK